MCVSAIGGKFRTGIQFFLLYRNEVSYKEKKRMQNTRTTKRKLFLYLPQSTKSRTVRTGMFCLFFYAPDGFAVRN